MTVQDLIRSLKALDPDDEVVIYIDQTHTPQITQIDVQEAQCDEDADEPGKKYVALVTYNEDYAPFRLDS